ncbi:hypothetical protein D3C71_2067710 [compost metagenome]
MLIVEIAHRQGEVAVAVAELIGLSAILVDCQLELEFAVFVAEIDQGEGIEVEPFGNGKPECHSVEVERLLFVEHPDHRMDCLGQVSLLRL